MTDAVRQFLEKAEQQGRVYLDVPVVGLTYHTVRHVSYDAETMLLRSREDVQNRFHFEAAIGAYHDSNSDKLGAKVIHDRSVRNLSRFFVKPPDYEPTRADFRVDAPPGVEAQVRVIRRDSPASTQTDEWYEINPLDLSLGGMGFEFDEDQNLQYGDVVELNLELNAYEEFNLVGTVVYVEYLDEKESYHGGLSFTDIEDQNRIQLFNFLNRIKVDRARKIG